MRFCYHAQALAICGSFSLTTIDVGQLAAILCFSSR